MGAGLILDIGHIGKPSPNHRDRGAFHGQRVEALLAAAYASYAEAAAKAAGVRVERINPPPEGWSYGRRHVEAARIAAEEPEVRWLYVQCHLNSSERDPRYGLVGHDARSRAGKVAATKLAEALADALVPTYLARVRVEAAAGSWARMQGTISGTYAGPANLCGVCYEPAFIQSDLWDRPDATAIVGQALAAGAVAWGTP